IRLPGRSLRPAQRPATVATLVTGTGVPRLALSEASDAQPPWINSSTKRLTMRNIEASPRSTGTVARFRATVPPWGSLLLRSPRVDRDLLSLFELGRRGRREAHDHAVARRRLDGDVSVRWIDRRHLTAEREWPRRGRARGRRCRLRGRGFGFRHRRRHPLVFRHHDDLIPDPAYAGHAAGDALSLGPLLRRLYGAGEADDAELRADTGREQVESAIGGQLGLHLRGNDLVIPLLTERPPCRRPTADERKRRKYNQPEHEGHVYAPH